MSGLVGRSLTLCGGNKQERHLMSNETLCGYYRPCDESLNSGFDCGSFVCIYNVEKVTVFWVYFRALVLP